MLNGDGNKNCKKKNSTKKKNNFARAEHFFAVVLFEPQRETFWLRVCTHQSFCYLTKCMDVPVRFFWFYCLSFLPCLLLLADHLYFLFSHPDIKFSCSNVPTKVLSFVRARKMFARLFGHFSFHNQNNSTSSQIF